MCVRDIFSSDRSDLVSLFRSPLCCNGVVWLFYNNYSVSVCVFSHIEIATFIKIKYQKLLEGNSCLSMFFGMFVSFENRFESLSTLSFVQTVYSCSLKMQLTQWVFSLRWLRTTSVFYRVTSDNMFTFVFSLSLLFYMLLLLRSLLFFFFCIVSKLRFLLQLTNP